MPVPGDEATSVAVSQAAESVSVKTPEPAPEPVVNDDGPVSDDQVAMDDQPSAPLPVLYEEAGLPVDELDTAADSEAAATEDTVVASAAAKQEIVVTMTEEPVIPVDEALANLEPDYRQWLGAKLEQSRSWLDSDDRQKLSIQVLVRKKSAARELVYYLRNEWPLDISQTYLYEVEIEGRSLYRVFYREFDSLNQAQSEIELLPDSVKVNSPYVHSVSRMRRALL